MIIKNNNIINGIQKRSLKMHNKMILQIAVYLIVVLSIAGCNYPVKQDTNLANDPVGTIVAATLTSMFAFTDVSDTQAITQTAATNPVITDSNLTSETPTLTPESTTGTVTGLICFTEITSTNLVVYFQNTADNKVDQLPVTVSNYQVPFSWDLKPGTYIAYAWNTDFSIGGTYSSCGLDSMCSDSSPKPFVVTTGQTLVDINVCDWSHGPFDVPYPPGFEAAVKFGTISGNIYGYPYGSLPQLTIVAFNKATGYWYWVGTATGQSYFSMLDIPAGTYQVVAYDASGHAGGSTSNIVVTGGQTTNVDINSWSGSYPANPLK